MVKQNGEYWNGMEGRTAMEAIEMGKEEKIIYMSTCVCVELLPASQVGTLSVCMLA
jgi:hypothetical protein